MVSVDVPRIVPLIDVLRDQFPIVVGVLTKSMAVILRSSPPQANLIS